MATDLALNSLSCAKIYLLHFQLSGACRSFHDVFFKLTIQERMAVIATDREKLKAKAMRSAASPGRPAISNATLKSIERRLSQ